MALPAVVLGVQCATVSATSLGVTVWARVAYDMGSQTMETVKSLPAVAAAKSNALVNSIHLSSVQRQPLRPSVTSMDGTVMDGDSIAPPVRRLTQARIVIEQCERKRIAEEQAKAAHTPKEDEWLGACGA